MPLHLVQKTPITKAQTFIGKETSFYWPNYAQVIAFIYKILALDKGELKCSGLGLENETTS